jgi:hypothetical protein
MPISGEYTENDALSFADAHVEVDLTPSTPAWAAIPSWATDIAVSGESIPTANTKPFKGSAIVFTGSKDPAQITCTIVFTQGSSDAYFNIRTLFESGDRNPMNIRWSPGGSGTTNLRFTSVGGKLTACPPPVGSGDANNANVVSFVIDADRITMDRIT